MHLFIKSVAKLLFSCCIVFHYYSGNEKDLLQEHHRRVSYNEEINFEQQVQEFLKEQEDDEDHNQHQWQHFDNGQLLMLQSNDDIHHNVDDNDNLDHDMVNNDNELTRNDDDLLLEMENCIN